MLSATISSLLSLFPVAGSEAVSSPEKTSPLRTPRAKRSVTKLWTKRRNSLRACTESLNRILSNRRYAIHGHCTMTLMRLLDRASASGTYRYHGLRRRLRHSPKTVVVMRSKNKLSPKIRSALRKRRKKKKRERERGRERNLHQVAMLNGSDHACSTPRSAFCLLSEMPGHKTLQTNWLIALFSDMLFPLLPPNSADSLAAALLSLSVLGLGHRASQNRSTSFNTSGS